MLRVGRGTKNGAEGSLPRRLASVVQQCRLPAEGEPPVDEAAVEAERRERAERRRRGGVDRRRDLPGVLVQQVVGPERGGEAEREAVAELRVHHLLVAGAGVGGLS